MQPAILGSVDLVKLGTAVLIDERLPPARWPRVRGQAPTGRAIAVAGSATALEDRKPFHAQ